jgi:ribonuclease HI
MPNYKYYAVARGRKTGVFTMWSEANEQIHGYPRPVFKGFHDLDAATAFWRSYRAAAEENAVEVTYNGRTAKLPLDAETEEFLRGRGLLPEP